MFHNLLACLSKIVMVAALLMLSGCLSAPTILPTPTPGVIASNPTRVPTPPPKVIVVKPSPPAIPTAGGGTSLDDKTLNDLVLDLSKTVQMQPGETRQFSLGVIACCAYFNPVQAQATWTVSPQRGAHMDAASGQLTLDQTVESGTVYTVSANVENGRRIVSIQVHIFTRQSNPLAVRMWREEAQFACESGKVVTPSQPIGELRFDADGSFTVTWMPFEVYHDYWGSYVLDSEQGTLNLNVTAGNYVPKDLDGNGRFSIDQQGRLSLTELWLGSPRAGKASVNCGHRFVPLR